MKKLLTRGHALLGATTVASVFITSQAFACGGFFCNGATPINQAAERIIFAQDEDQITQIVEVLYEGEAEKFSWVLPVPGKPKPGVSSVQAFDRLQQATNPTYQLQANFPESCGLFNSPSAGGDSSGDGDLGVEGGPQVTVIDAGTVGPFDYETISVDAADEDPAAVAVRWLETNGYDVGPKGPDVLRPYLENGLNLIAFRLTRGQEAGAIRPITLQYESKSMSIPIRPTAVAANDDMPILVWVLGQSRAVSTNYRGLEINELLIDWFNPAATYNQVVTAAADEAKGQGFVTELAGDAGIYAETIAPSWEAESLRSYTISDPIDEVLISITDQFGGYDGFLEIAAELPLRDGITAADFTSCAYCYFYPGQAPGGGFGGATGMGDERIANTDPIFGVNLNAFFEDFENKVIAPLVDTAELFRTHDYVTRLYTTMSAEEMDRDPVFKFNPDLEDVSNTHVAQQDLECDSDKWVVTLANGQKVAGEGRTWPHALDNTELKFNTRVLQYSTSGAPEVIADNTKSIQTIHDKSPAGYSFRDESGGCSVSPGGERGFAWAWLVSLALGGTYVARRRRGTPVVEKRN